MDRSKFLIPRTSSVLARDRLAGRLAAWDDKKLVIIHAQAGQGKSTLAAAYAKAQTAAPVWYAMDAGDGDPAVFLACLGEALRSARPEQFPNIPPVPRSRSGLRGQEPAITRWLGKAFGSLTRPLLIVFDDYHLASFSPALRAIFKLLVETTPPPVRIVLLSRTRPDLDIACLRARRGAAELTGNDLRFNDGEAQELFGVVFGMPVTPAEAAAINRTVEGWPAGLVLLHGCFSSSPGRDRNALLCPSSRTELHAHAFQYLAQEVFASLPAKLQDFLLRTSVTDGLTAPLMSLLSGLPVSAGGNCPSVSSMAAELKRRNLFVTTGDEDSGVIRYHALFREFLLRTLGDRFRRPAVRKLYAAAADYYRTAGDRVRSVNLWLEADEQDRAVREMESCVQDLIARGRVSTVLRWIEALPASATRRPWFLYARAVACRYTDPQAALALYDQAHRGFRRDRNLPGHMLSQSGIIESCFHTGGDFPRMGRSAVQAKTLLAQCRRGSPAERARLLLATGMAWFFTGKLGQSADALAQALALFRKQGDHFSQVTCAIYLIPCALYQGDFRLARDTVRHGLEASDAIPDETGGRTALYLTRAMTDLFEGNFNEAEQSIEQCRKLADDHSLESIGFLSLDIGGWLKIAQGDFSGAVRLLEECKRKGEEARHPFFSASAAHLLAIACLFQGKFARAQTESDRALALQKRSESPLFHGIYLIASGAILLKQGKTERAERQLAAALGLLRQCNAAQQEANAHLLLASLNLTRKREAAVRRHLTAGFSIGEERGFTYYALLRQDELAALAKAAADRGIEPDYCQRLIAGPDTLQSSPRIKIYCLGEFRVLRKGIPIRDGEWKSRLAKTLVKVLALRDSGKLTRDEAGEILWPGADAAQQRLLLNSLLHRTRRALEPKQNAVRGDSCIIQEGDILFLNPRTVWTDIREFSELHATARQKHASRDQDAGKVLALYDRAFSLYRGDCLPGDLYSDWAQVHREHMRKIHAEMLTHAAALTEAQDDRNRTFTYYERMFSLDPCNEKACRWLMAWHAAGQRGDAVRLYERCQLALRTELDIEPDEQTKKLYRSIIGG